MRSRQVKNMTVGRERSKGALSGEPRSVGTVRAEGGKEFSLSLIPREHFQWCVPGVILALTRS